MLFDFPVKGQGIPESSNNNKTNSFLTGVGGPLGNCNPPPALLTTYFFFITNGKNMKEDTV